MRRSYPATVLLFDLAWYLASALGDPLSSPVRSESAESPVQNSVLRSDQTWYDDWTPDTADDWVVMGHDRKSSSVVGYQKSTGKVFSQRQPTGMGGSRIMHFDTAFVIQMPQSNQEEQASHCPVLRHSSVGEASDPHLEWAESPTALTDAAHRLWSVKGHTGWGEAATSKLSLRADTDTELQCDCVVRRSKSSVYRNTLLRRVESCAPLVTPPVRDIHDIESYSAAKTRVTAKTVAFCGELERTMRLGGGEFFAVSMHWWQAQRKQGGPSSCIQKARRALSHLHEQGLHSVALDPTNVPRQPRAQVLMQLKHTAQLLDAIDGTTASMTFMMEQLLALVRRGLSDRELERLHGHDRKTEAAVQRRQAALNASKAADPDEGQALLPLSYERTCTAVPDQLVSSLLQARVAWTPERVNTTKVTYAMARYVLRQLQCHQTQVEATSASVDCMSGSLAGAERLQTAALHDGLTGVLTAMSGVSDAGSAIQALKSATNRRYSGEAMVSGNTPEAMADETAELATQAAEAVLRRMSSVAGSFATSMDVWKRIFNRSAEVVPTRAANWTRTDAIEDIWCCAVLEPLPVVKSDLYPSCLPHSLRQIRRELRRM